MKKTLLTILTILPFYTFSQITSFTFSTSGNAEGWVKGQTGATLTADGNAMVLNPGTVTGNFLDINNATNIVNGDNFKGLTIKLKNTTVSTDLRLRVTVGATTQFRQVTISTTDTNFINYYFDLNTVAGTWDLWTGNVTGQSLRLTKAASPVVWSNTSNAEFDEITFTPTALSEINFNSEINKIEVYPNPAVNNLKFKSNIEIKNIELFDLKGQLLNKINFDNNSINIANLSTGVYLLKATDINGTISTVKFIKN